jgi:hypothetical protein
MVTFVVASQVYGDPFVLLLLGWSLGLLVGTLGAETIPLRAWYPPPASSRLATIALSGQSPDH